MEEVAVVTGASAGIGEAIAQRLLDSGHTVDRAAAQTTAHFAFDADSLGASTSRTRRRRAKWRRRSRSNMACVIS